MVRSTAVAALRTALDSHPILAGLSSSALDDVWQSGVVEHFEPGAALSREGDPARHYWLLLSGSVKVSYLSPDGFEVTVKLFGAPAAWAEMQVLTGKPHIEDCVAVDVSTSLKVPRAAFERLLEAWPRFMKNVLYDTCARFFISAQHERALAFLPVERRLANLLFAHVRMYGIPVEGGVDIELLFTADIVAGSTVMRTMASTDPIARESFMLYIGLAFMSDLVGGPNLPL